VEDSPTSLDSVGVELGEALVGASGVLEGAALAITDRFVDGVSVVVGLWLTEGARDGISEGIDEGVARVGAEDAAREGDGETVGAVG
jgi:hypothetical protein